MRFRTDPVKNLSISYDPVLMAALGASLGSVSMGTRYRHRRETRRLAGPQLDIRQPGGQDPLTKKTMSRSGKRLEHFSEATKKRSKEIKPSEPWTWREKASVWISLAAVGIFALIPFVDQTIKHHRSIEVRLENWRADYDLTAETVEKLRVIESAFHAFEGPFSMAPHPSALEAEAHGLEIAKHLTPENAKLFLEREAANHEKHRGNAR